MPKAFKFFNLFSQSPSLRISGDFKPPSIFGSIVGLFTVAITLVAIFFILYTVLLNQIGVLSKDSIMKELNY